MSYQVLPPSAEIVEASKRLAAKFKRENAVYTFRLDLAHEYGLEAHPQFDAMLDTAMERARQDLFEARRVFRELVQAMA